MTLIEGIGDEVVHFFVALFVILVVTVAWWTTNISDHGGHIRTVLLLDNRRSRTQRRLTNHTESVNIIEESVEVEDSANSGSASASASMETPKPPEETPDQPNLETNSEDLEIEEQNHIVETMDSDTQVIRQRRLAFYDRNPREDSELPQIPSQECRTKMKIERENLQALKMEHNYADASAQAEASTEGATTSTNTSEDQQDKGDSIKIKLKYINDDLRLVDGNLQEMLGDFKRRHFQQELTTDKLVKLIFQGQVLQQDSRTLQSCGLFDNCVVHCLIHNKRASSSEDQHSDTLRDTFFSSATLNRNGQGNNNNQGRDWDLGNFLFVLISFSLGAAWYLRYVYAHLYTLTATIGLVLMTGIFSVVLIGMHFPDDEQIHQAQRTENIQSQ